MPTIEAKCPQEVECARCGEPWSPEITESGDCPDCMAPESELCLVCAERPIAYALCDESGEVSEGQGYCRDCAPVQPDEEAERAQEAAYRALSYQPVSLADIDAMPTAISENEAVLREAWHFELLNAEAEIAELTDSENELLDAARALTVEGADADDVQALSLIDQAFECHAARAGLLNHFGAALEREARYLVAPKVALPVPVLAPGPAPCPVSSTVPLWKSKRAPQPMTGAQKIALQSMGAAAFGRHSRDADLDRAAQNLTGKAFDDLSKSEASELFGKMQKLRYGKPKTQH